VGLRQGISGASAPASLKRRSSICPSAPHCRYFRGIRPGLIEAPFLGSTL